MATDTTVSSYFLNPLESTKKTLVLAKVEKDVPVMIKVDLTMGEDDVFDNEVITGSKLLSYLNVVMVWD